MHWNRVGGCHVCTAIEHEPEVVVFETAFHRVVLHPDQAYLGRAIFTTQHHVGTLEELSEYCWIDLGQITARYADMVKRQLGAQHLTMAGLMNNAYQEPNPRPHVHWHVRPRYSRAACFAGEVFRDPEFGHHHQRERKDLRSIDFLEELAATLNARA